MEIKLVHVTKSFGAKQVIPAYQLCHSKRQPDHIAGTFRLRQDHPVADDRRTGNAGQR